MTKQTSIQRFTNLSKITKLNVFLLTLVILAASMAVTFASNSTTQCGARVAMVLDRSSSIGVDTYSGSRQQSDSNIHTIKQGAIEFVNALKGPDSYTDLYAFGSVAQRINGVPSWYNLGSQENVDIQNWVIATTKFKQGVKSSDENAYDDGMLAGSEGLTNWDGALQLVGSTRQDPLPDAIVFFTDGNPTTNQAETQAALAHGGSYAAAGIKNVDGTDPDDISSAVRVANFLREIGIKIVPVAVGSEQVVNMANLQALAGPGNPVYRANDYSELVNKFKEAAANVCVPPSTPANVVVSAVDENQSLLSVPVQVGISGAYNPFDANNTVKNTSSNPANPWEAQWPFETTGTWGASIQAKQVPQGYVPVGDRCRRDNWNGAGAVDLEQVNGTGDNNLQVDIASLAQGGTVYCQFIFKKLNDGIEIIKDVSPTTAKRGEAVTYSFVVKNTGNTKLTNISVTDPMFGGQIGTIESLEPGAQTPLSNKNYTIPKDATGTIHNVATVTGTPVNPDGTARPNVTDDDPADVNVELRQSQTIEKSVTPTVAQVGTEVTYTITVKNTGETVLTNVAVTDAKLGQELVVDGPIQPGETDSVQVKYTLKDGDFTDGVFTNIACIKGTQTCDDAKVTEPKVELTKSGPANAKPGQKVTYTFTVKNVGATDLTNFVIKDDTLSKFTTTPVSIAFSGTLKPGETSEVIKYEFTIPKTYPGNVFENTAVVHSNPIDPETKKPIETSDVKDDDDHDIALIRWTTKKTVDKSEVVPGATVTYTISVTNTGGADITNLQVSDPTINFPADGKPVVIESLPVGATKTVVATYVIPANFEGKTFKNTALVCLPGEDGSPKPPTTTTSTTSSTTTTSSSTTTTSSTNPGSSTTSTTTPNKDNNTVGDEDCQQPTAEVAIARIDIVKTADKQSALPGEKVVYTFVVTNTGGVTLDPTVVTDDVLGEIGDPGELKPGESEEFTKEYVVPEDAKDQSTITNTATVCAPVGTTTDEALQKNDCVTQCPQDSLTTVCDQDDHDLLVLIPGITIDKTADKTSASVGESVNYTFTITNVSEVELKNVTLVDNVLGDLGKVDSLAPGETVTKTVAYVVTSTSLTEGTIHNIATACFAEPVYVSNCATDDHTLSVVAVQGTSVTKSETLPFTGSESRILTMIGAALVAAGVAISLIARRRKFNVN